jgi:hypothetical protein
MPTVNATVVRTVKIRPDPANFREMDANRPKSASPAGSGRLKITAASAK